MATISQRIVACMVLAASALAIGAEPAKPKTELVLDTPENALKSYTTAWLNIDYPGILGAIKVTDPKMKPVVERYVNFMMWQDVLERACVAKFGEDEGMKALGHVRTLVKQYQLDIKTRIGRSNVEVDSADHDKAHIFLRVEKDRPAGLTEVDSLTFRDDFYVIKDGTNWKVDFLRTYKLDPDHDSDTQYNATQLYPALIRKMKDLTEGVKAGKVSSVDQVKAEIEAIYNDPPGVKEDDNTPAATDAATPAK